MLLDNQYTIIPSIKFSLTYDNGVRKVITVNSKDLVYCEYKKNGEKFTIKGFVTKIGCNFNSSLGAIGTTAYMQIDGSHEYCGHVEFIQPSQVINIEILLTTNTIENAICSVDNDDQRVALIRENEAGVFQYSLDGIKWKPVTGGQGPSAYECAVKLGFEGSEDEWLKSLVVKCQTQEQITVENSIGGYSVGDIISAGTPVLDILKHILAPTAYPINKIYFGVSDTIPTNLTGLESQDIDNRYLMTNGITHKYTAENKYLIYAYDKHLGTLSSIKDINGFETINNFSKLRNEFID